MKLSVRIKGSIAGALIGVGMLASSCGSEQDYSFNMSLLRENWQKRLFIEAAAYNGIETGHNASSKNLVSWRDLGTDTARLYIKPEDCKSLDVGCEEGKRFEIIYSSKDEFADCSKGREEDLFKVDFSKTSKHEWGHIRGFAHSSDPNDPMYPYAKDCSGNLYFSTTTSTFLRE